MLSAQDIAKAVTVGTRMVALTPSPTHGQNIFRSTDPFVRVQRGSNDLGSTTICHVVNMFNGSALSDNAERHLSVSQV